MTPVARIGSVTLICALLVGACSSGESSPVPEDQQMPIDALLAGSGVAAASAQDGFDRAELYVKECMAAQGFEYFPRTIALDVDVDSLPAEELQTFAAGHGYGLTEALLPDGTAMRAVHAGVLPAFIEFDLSALGLPETDSETDQNDLYLLTLNPDEQDAYQVALEGRFLANDELNDEPTDLGCMGMEEAPSQDQPATPAWLEEASFLVEERLQSAAGEFDQVERRWAGCMADHGFDEFSARIDAPESVRSGILSLVTQVKHPEAALDATGLHKLHEYEMELAAADAACYSAVYRPAVRGIEYRIQSEVLTELGVIEG